MNTAATLAFTAVMVLGMGGLTGLIWRDRRRTTPPAADPLDADVWPLPHTVYEQTVAALGDPTHIHTDLPCPPWPEAAA